MKSHVEALNMKSVFSHNDLLLQNIVVTENQGLILLAKPNFEMCHLRALCLLDRAFFIDYEYGAFNYEAYDIANHFNEWAGIREFSFPDLNSNKWRVYLTKKI